jgi:hypothetical protein
MSEKNRWEMQRNHPSIRKYGLFVRAFSEVSFVTLIQCGIMYRTTLSVLDDKE